MFKKVYMYLLCLSVVSAVFFAPTLKAQPSETISKKISYAVVPNFKPASYINEQGEPDGIFVALLKEIARVHNFEVQYHVMPWAEGLDSLASNKIDLLGCAIKTQARKMVFDYGSESILTGWGHVRIHVDSEIDNILSLDGKKIGVVLYDQSYADFKKLAESFGVHCTYVELATHKELVSKIISKEIDAGVFFNMRNLPASRYIKNSTIVFHPAAIYFMTAKGENTKLLKIISTQIASWKQDKSSPYYKILDKYSDIALLREHVIPSWVRPVGWGIIFLFVFLVFVALLLKYIVNRRSKQLILSRSRFSKIVENMPIMLTALDANLQSVIWNKEAEIITGYSSAEIVNNPDWLKLIYPDDAYRQAVIDGLEPGTFFFRNREFRVTCKDGTEKIIDWSCISDKYPVKGWFAWGVGVDITALKKTEAELIRAKEHAEESEKIKTSFLAGISHEIRTPMNGILGFANLLQDTDITADEKEEYIRIIEKSGKRMLSIINDLIDISKIESGHVSLYYRPTPVNALLDDLVAFFKPEALSKGVKLICKQPLSLEESIIEVDKDRIIQVLVNLLTNSLKFTHAGEILFGYTKKKDILEFYVRDTGIGIDTAMQDIIFERFKQLDTASGKKYEGSGLGLSISKAFIEMHGGKMWVESEIGEGACFYFTLPYKKGLSLRKSKVKAGDTDAINYKSDAVVLIAEDDLSSYYLLKKIMDKNNIATMYAPDGKKAVEIVEANDNIDIVFMDVQMPVMDGLTATKLIKEKRPELVVIAQTAFAQTEDREKVMEAGCDDFVTKPLNIPDLLELMGNYIGG